MGWEDIVEEASKTYEEHEARKQAQLQMQLCDDLQRIQLLLILKYLQKLLFKENNSWAAAISKDSPSADIKKSLKNLLQATTSIENAKLFDILNNGDPIQLQDLIKTSGENSVISCLANAKIGFLLGTSNLDKSFDWLEKAVKIGVPGKIKDIVLVAFYNVLYVTLFDLCESIVFLEAGPLEDDGALLDIETKAKNYASTREALQQLLRIYLLCTSIENSSELKDTIKGVASYIVNCVSKDDPLAQAILNYYNGDEDEITESDQENNTLQSENFANTTPEMKLTYKYRKYESENDPVYKKITKPGGCALLIAFWVTASIGLCASIAMVIK